jgi:hypothetical protein
MGSTRVVRGIYGPDKQNWYYLGHIATSQSIPT